MERPWCGTLAGFVGQNGAFPGVARLRRWAVLSGMRQPTPAPATRAVLAVSILALMLTGTFAVGDAQEAKELEE